MSAPDRPERALLADDLLHAHPVHVVWEITLACNLKCAHCGSRAGKVRPDELTTEECFDVVDQLARLGTREITVIGGEAYLRRDWTDIIARISSHGILPSMQTGGRALTEERIRAAKAAGLRTCGVSVDGTGGLARRDPRRERLLPLRNAGAGAAAEVRHPQRLQHADRQPDHAATARNPARDRKPRREGMADPAHRRDGQRGRQRSPADAAVSAARADAAPRGAVRRGAFARRDDAGRQQHRLLRSLRAQVARRQRGDALERLQRRPRRPRHRSRRRDQRLPVASDRAIQRRQRPRHDHRRHLDLQPRDPFFARPPDQRAVGPLPRLLLRRRLPRRLHLDLDGALRPSGQQSVLPPPRARAGEAGTARARVRRRRKRPARRSIRDVSISSPSRSTAATASARLPSRRIGR